MPRACAWTLSCDLLSGATAPRRCLGGPSCLFQPLPSHGVSTQPSRAPRWSGSSSRASLTGSVQRVVRFLMLTCSRLQETPFFPAADCRGSCHAHPAAAATDVFRQASWPPPLPALRGVQCGRRHQSPLGAVTTPSRCISARLRRGNTLFVPGNTREVLGPCALFPRLISIAYPDIRGISSDPHIRVTARVQCGLVRVPRLGDDAEELHERLCAR